MENFTIIYGLFINNLWRDEKNGKSFFLLKTKHSLFMECMFVKKEVIRNNAGIDEDWYWLNVDASNISIPAYRKNSPLCIKGYFNTRNTGTWDFIAVEVIESSNDVEMTIQYLSSDQFPDISRNMAEKIVAVTGCDIHGFVTSKNAKKTFQDITELPKDTVDSIFDVIESTNLEMQLFRILSMASIPFPYCSKAVRYFGKKAIEKIVSDTYSTGSKIGLSFEQCDKIHKALNGNAYDTKRLQSACKDTMDFFAAQGNIYTPIKLFKKQVVKKLKKGAFTDDISAVNVVAVMPEDFAIMQVGYENVIYSKKLVEAEKNVARNIKRLAQETKEKFSPDLIEYASKACNMEYGNQQKEAFATALSTRGIKIITGGPGTGKTTTIKGILLAYEKMHPNHKIRLCAPTGRASQRMSESTEMPACTIHRLLDFKPYGKGRETHKDANDPIDADLIVVDEMSMTDIVLFDMLLDAVKTGTSLIFVGDTHQLESVGAGAVLHDLILANDNLIKKSHLTEVYRQKEGSSIIDNSKLINEGNTKLISSNDFQIYNTKSEEESLEIIKNLTQNLYNHNAPYETQVLCPARLGLTGINNLNIVLHDLLNSTGQALIYGKQQFRVGDKVIMTRNNTYLDYYNGDVGIIEEILDHGFMVRIRKDAIVIERELLEDVELSYSMTIHKSQGSEFKNVIVVMPMNPSNMLVRNLFYTAVTRAKQKVFIVNEASAMQTAIKTDKSGSRRTLLASYLNA